MVKILPPSFGKKEVIKNGYCSCVLLKKWYLWYQANVLLPHGLCKETFMLQ